MIPQGEFTISFATGKELDTAGEWYGIQRQWFAVEKGFLAWLAAALGYQINEAEKDDAYRQRIRDLIRWDQ